MDSWAKEKPSTSEEKIMKKYQIESTDAVLFGIYEAESEEMALEALARDAGYATYAIACEASSVDADEILVTEI